MAAGPVPAAATNSGVYYGWVVVGAGFVAALFTYGISYYSFSVFLKPMAAEFEWSRGATSLAMTFYSLIYGGLGMVMGTLTDRYGPRITVTIGAVLLGLGGLLMSRIDSLWQLYFCYAFFMGGALATMWVPLSTTVSRWFVARRGLAVGILAGGAGAAAILGAPLTTYLVAQFEWRTAYLILGIDHQHRPVIPLSYLPGVFLYCTDGVNDPEKEDHSNQHGGYQNNYYRLKYHLI